MYNSGLTVDLTDCAAHNIFIYEPFLGKDQILYIFSLSKIMKVFDSLLQVNGEDLSWNTIEAFYEYDLNRASISPGLRKCTKLTHDHIFLGPRTRMRVNLAVQVTRFLCFFFQFFLIIRSILFVPKVSRFSREFQLNFTIINCLWHLI